MKTLESVISDRWSVISSRAAGMAATDHAPRTTHHATRPSPAFTLIELLVVISVIAILAALSFPAISAVKVSMTRTRALAEMKGVIAVIEAYHDKLGYYPPDNPLNPPNWAINQLYYELLGTTNVSIGGVPYYQTLDGSAKIANVPPSFPAFQTAFGAGSTVVSFMNISRDAGDGLVGAVSFFPNLKPSQFLAITNGGGSATPICTVLGAGIDGPLLYHDTLGAKLNPWCYNSSSPRYNPKSYDLWIDVTAGNKTNRICNWSDKALIVNAPYP